MNSLSGKNEFFEQYYETYYPYIFTMTFLDSFNLFFNKFHYKGKHITCDNMYLIIYKTSVLLCSTIKSELKSYRKLSVL